MRDTGRRVTQSKSKAEIWCNLSLRSRGLALEPRDSAQRLRHCSAHRPRRMELDLRQLLVSSGLTRYVSSFESGGVHTLAEFATLDADDLESLSIVDSGGKVHQCVAQAKQQMVRFWARSALLPLPRRGHVGVPLLRVHLW